MFSLKLLGGALVEHEGGALTGPAAQRHRLALLALLAAAHPRGVARDRLLAYLWPESDAAHARNLLNQAVYVLRKALGRDALRSAGDALRLDPGVVPCDVIAFEEALAAGDLEGAAGRYAGPFLDGFFLPEASAFEHWAAGERERLHHAYCKALKGLAEAAEARGDREGAVEGWRRLAAAEPDSARVTLSLMEALEAVGDRAGALRQADAHAVRLREELDAEPHPEVVALAERMRAAPLPAPPLGDGEVPPEVYPRLAPDLPPPRTEQVAPGLEPYMSVAGGGDGQPRGSEARPPPPARPGWRRRALAGALAVPVLLAGLWALWRFGGAEPSGSAPSASSSVLAVMPFSVGGEPALGYLQEGMVDLLSHKLDGAGTLRSVDPNALLSAMGDVRGAVRDPRRGRALAAQFGAGHFILGSVTRLGDQLQLNASLYNTNGALQTRAAAAAADEAALPEAIDALTIELIAGLLTEPDHALASLAATTTPSLEALKAYLDGEQAMRSGAFEAAVEAYAHAVETDSTFALAWYRLHHALGWPSYNWASFRISSETALENTLQYRDRLPDHVQQIVRASEVERERGDAAEAERLLREVLIRHPDHPLALFQMGEVLYHRNPIYGRPAAEARAPFERMLAYNPYNPEALVHLMEIALQEGRHDRYDTLAARYVAVSDSLNRRWKNWERRMVRAEPVARAALLDELREAPASVRYVVLSVLALQLRDLPGALRMTRQRDAARTRWLLGRLEVARGRFDAGLAHLRAIDGEGYGEALLWRVLLRTLPFSPPAVSSQPELEALRDEVAAWDPAAAPITGTYDGDIKVYLDGRLSAHLGDEAGTRDAVRRLDERGGEQSDRALARSLARTLEALLAQQDGDHGQTIRLIEVARVAPLYPGHPLHAQPLNRFLRGEALLAQGRSEGALRWYASLGDGYDWAGLEYLGPAYRRQAHIYERLGDTEKAIDFYTRFVLLWENGDRALRPWVEEARLRLDQLQAGRSEHEGPGKVIALERHGDGLLQGRRAEEAQAQVRALPGRRVSEGRSET